MADVEQASQETATSEQVISSVPEPTEPEQAVEETEKAAAPPSEETVTSVADTVKIVKPEPEPEPEPHPEPEPVAAPQPKSVSTSSSSSKKMASSSKSTSSRSSSTRRTIREYTDTSNLLSDLTRDYRGTSPAVLESIASHPALYSRHYLPEQYNPKLSAKSRRVIRDAEELAFVSPGLKNLLEVQYYLCVRVSVPICCFYVSCHVFAAL